MDRVTNVESQRIVHVLDETIQKITLISAITKELTALANPAQVEELTEHLGSEFVEHMRELKAAEEVVSSKIESKVTFELSIYTKDFKCAC